MKVLDASVLANALSSSGEAGNTARRVLSSEHELIAPDTVISESFAAMRRLWIRRESTDLEFELGLIALESFEIGLIPSKDLLRDAFRHKHNVGAHDSLYVTLAENIGCPLITSDKKLSRAPGIKCEVIALV
jgi:predicted nucleic acid-binding protein